MISLSRGRQLVVNVSLLLSARWRTNLVSEARQVWVQDSIFSQDSSAEIRLAAVTSVGCDVIHEALPKYKKRLFVSDSSDFHWKIHPEKPEGEKISEGAQEQSVRSSGQIIFIDHKTKIIGFSFLLLDFFHLDD